VRQRRKREKLHCQLPRAPENDALVLGKLGGEVAVDLLHLLGGMPDIRSNASRQLPIADRHALVPGSAVVSEEAENGWVESICCGPDYFLFHEHRLEAKAAGGVFESPRRKVIDVLGIELLERRVEIVVVTGGVWSFKIQAAARRQQPASRCEERGNVVDMFQHVAEDDAIEFRHVRRRRGDRSDIGLKAPIATRGRAARRRIESGDGCESLLAKRGEQAAVAQPASRMLAAREGRARAMSEAVVASRAAS